MSRFAGSRFGGSRGGAGGNGKFRIIGSSEVGQTLSLSSVPVQGTGPDLIYRPQWFRDGTPIAGATNSTYVTNSLDVGREITATVTPNGSAPIVSQNSLHIVAIEDQLAPAALDPSAWSVEIIQGDTSNVGIRFFGPYPDQGAAPITSVRRQRIVDSATYAEYHLRQGGQLPVIGQRYVVPADPGVINYIHLYCTNGQGTPNKGVAKAIMPWVALGAPAAYVNTTWDLEEIPGDATGALLTVHSQPVNPDTGIEATTWIEIDSGAGYGNPIQLTGVKSGYTTRISLPAGTSQVRIWDDNGQTPVNKGTAKSITPWVNNNVAPVYQTQPTITPDSGQVGTVFTLDQGTVSGYPTPTTGITLTLGTTDVTASIVNTGGVLTYTSTAAGTLTLVGTATNTVGSVSSNSVTATVSAPAASTLSLMGGYYLEAPNPIVYVADPVNGLQVQNQTGLKLRHTNEGGTSSDTVSMVRNGAQFRPQNGVLGHKFRPVLGFDGRMVDGGSTVVYSDAVNVSPERTGVPYTIPGSGALVLATSNPGTIPTGYSGQRSNGAVMEYMVVHFAPTAPVAGGFRSGARGTVAPRSNWTAAQVAARLDTAFPRGLSGFSGVQGMTAADVAGKITRMKTPSSSWTMGYEMATYSPQLGISGYGRDRSFALGAAMLLLRATSTTYITDAQRLEMALALVRQGIDWYCAVVDGAWWQENGAATQGAMWAVLAAGLLLDDQYMMNMVLAPETAESAPGLVLGYRPFTEQRNYLYVEAAARTSGNPENVNWGIYVGSGGSASGDQNFPDSIKIDDGMLGVPEWAISPGRNNATGNSAHLSSKYRSENAEGITPAVAALHDAFNGTHAGYNLTPLQVIARYRDRIAWIKEAHGAAVTAGMSTIDILRFRPQLNTGWGGSVLNNENTIYNACVPSNSRWYGKPERPFSPNVAATGNSVTVTFHPWVGAHGRTVTGRKIYWSDDDGATWNTISGIAGNATSHTFMATASATILVQTSIITDQGESPRSVNQDNYQAANSGAGTGLQGVIATGAASTTTYTATVDDFAAPLIFFDSGKARGADAADIPLSGTTTAPNGATIEVQLVRSDTLAEVYPWQAIATASAGVWSGVYLTASRTHPRLKVRVRVAGSSAAAGLSAREIKIGHIAMLIGQSEEHHMIMDVKDDGRQSTPTLVDAAAADSVFLMQWQGSGFAANGIQAINPTNRGTVAGVTRSMLHMADVLTRNAPGENFLFIAAIKSGTSYAGLVDDRDDSPSGDDRAWSQTFGDALTYIRQWGTDVGVVMSTWTAAPSTIAGGYRIGHYPIFSGLYADTASNIALPAYGALVDTVYCPAGYRLDHGLWDLSGLDRPQAAFDPAITKMFFYGPHRFEDDLGVPDANKQSCRNLIRAMVADPVLAPIMLPKGPEILTYQNGFGVATVGGSTYEPNPANWVAWTDWAHPTQYSDDGLPARARHTAVAMLYAFGLGPAPAVRRDVPKFNRAYWDPAGAFVQLWYEDATGACPRISTTRRERSESAIPATYPHRTEVAGFYRKNVPCTDVVIATGVSTGTDVVQINADGDPFDYTDTINYGLGGASGVVQWPQDEYDSIWKNLPIAVTGLAGVTGIALEPLPSSATLANPLPAPQLFAMSNATLTPRFVDPAQIGSTSELTLRWKGRFDNTVGDTVFGLSGTQLTVKRRTSGASTIRRIEIMSKDSGGASMVADVNTGVYIEDGQIVDIVISFSLVAGNRFGKMFVNGVQVWSVALGGSATTWQTNRQLSVLQLQGTGTPTGATELVEIWKDYTADGNVAALGTPYKRISGGTGGTVVENAGTSNTSTWRVA